MVPGMKYFRFCASDNRCDMASNNVDPEAWEKLEAVTRDYLESVSDSLDEAAAILLSGIDTSRVHRSTPKEVRLGPRKGLVVVDCPTPGCKWGKDVAMLCSALEHTVLRVNLGACVETDSVGNNTVLKELEEVLKDEELMKETIAAGHFLKKNNITFHTKQALVHHLQPLATSPQYRSVAVISVLGAGHGQYIEPQAVQIWAHVFDGALLAE